MRYHIVSRNNHPSFKLIRHNETVNENNVKIKYGMVEAIDDGETKTEIIRNMDVFPVTILIDREKSILVLNKGSYDIWLCDPIQPYFTKRKLISVAITASGKLILDIKKEIQNLSEEKREKYCTMIYMEKGQIKLQN